MGPGPSHENIKSSIHLNMESYVMVSLGFINASQDFWQYDTHYFGGYDNWAGWCLTFKLWGIDHISKNEWRFAMLNVLPPPKSLRRQYNWQNDSMKRYPVIFSYISYVTFENIFNMLLTGILLHRIFNVFHNILDILDIWMWIHSW